MNISSCKLQVQHVEGFDECRIVCGDRFGAGRDQPEGLEQCPVFQIVFVAREIAGSVEIPAAGLERRQLRDSAWGVALENCGVEIIEAEPETFSGEAVAKVDDLFGGADVSVVAGGPGVAEQALIPPLRRDRAQGKEVVFPFDFVELLREREIEAKPSQSFEKNTRASGSRRRERGSSLPGHRSGCRMCHRDSRVTSRAAARDRACGQCGR